MVMLSGRFGLVKEYLRAVRVRSWIGWLFNFGLGSILFGFPPVGRALVVSFAFSLATASIFVLNQYFDREADRENEAKAVLPVASGRITPRGSLVFSISLASLCLTSVWMADASLIPLFLIYLGLGTAYSAPLPHFKTVPVVDFLVSGIGAGLLPFIMGLEVSHQLTPYPFDLSYSWVRRRYYDALLTAAPLMLFYSGSHIIHTVGDYEADRKTGLQTFAVKYGRKKAVKLARFMFLAAVLSPFLYLASGLLSLGHLPWYLLILPFAAPVATLYAKVSRNPSTMSVASLQKVATRHGPLALASLWIYVFLLKMFL